MALRGSNNVSNTVDTTTIAVSVNTIGIQQNDIVLLVGLQGGSGTLTPTFPSGFNAIPSLSNVNVNGSTLFAAYKVATSSEPSSYTVTPGNSSTGTLHCRVYSGRNTSTTFTAVASTGAQGPTTLPVTYNASAVTAAANDDVAAFYFTEPPNSSDTFTFGTPSGFANGLTSTSGTIWVPGAFSADHVNVSAGTTGSIGSAASDTDGKSIMWAAYTLSLAASAATTLVTPSAGSVAVTGNTPAVTNAINTVIQTFVA